VSTWHDVASAEPEFADRVRRVFDAHRHKTLATLRRDGSPRISGIEAEFIDGEVWLGMMPDSVKAQDLRRDPRLALHSGSEDPPPDNPSAWIGDAKVAGLGVAAAAPGRPGPPATRFRIDIREVVLITIGDSADHLVIESWHPDRGLRRRQRS
jgi:pyridoxamine 5'-phosphate oxidase-like protein